MRESGTTSIKDFSPGKAAKNEEDDLEALIRAIMAPLTTEESDDRYNLGLLIEIASSNRRSIEAIQGHMVLYLPQFSSDLPSPPRHPSKGPGAASTEVPQSSEMGTVQSTALQRSKAVLAAIDGTWYTPDNRPSSDQMLEFWRPLFESQGGTPYRVGLSVLDVRSRHKYCLRWN